MVRQRRFGHMDNLFGECFSEMYEFVSELTTDIIRDVEQSLTEGNATTKAAATMKTSKAGKEVPKVTCEQEKDGLIIRAELPGYTRDEVTASIDEDNVLRIDARTQDDEKDWKSRREFSYQGRIASEVDVGRAEGVVVNGLLTLRVPYQKKEKMLPKYIPIT